MTAVAVVLLILGAALTAVIPVWAWLTWSARRERRRVARLPPVEPRRPPAAGAARGGGRRELHAAQRPPAGLDRPRGTERGVVQARPAIQFAWLERAGIRAAGRRAAPRAGAARVPKRSPG